MNENIRAPAIGCDEPISAICVEEFDMPGRHFSITDYRESLGLFAACISGVPGIIYECPSAIERRGPEIVAIPAHGIAICEIRLHGLPLFITRCAMKIGVEQSSSDREHESGGQQHRTLPFSRE